MALQEFMVIVTDSGFVFVKERGFFVQQGGCTEAWGKRWQTVHANSIEDAREQACRTLPGARAYAEQQRLR